MSETKKGIIFYDNWCDLVNEYYDDGDQEAAQMLSFAIVRLYSTGEVIELPRKDLNRMLQYCISAGIESQVKHYEDGCKGGRPSKLNDEDQTVIAEMRSNGYSAKQIAEHFGVGLNTIKRSAGWTTQNSTQNPKPNPDLEGHASIGRPINTYSEQGPFGPNKPEIYTKLGF